MSKKLWVGLDVGAEVMSVCVVNDRGEPVLEVAMPPEANMLDAALRPMRRGNVASVALESGSVGLHLARELKQIGYRVSIFDSRQVGKFIGIRQNKTDRNDARCIADVARIGRDVVSEVHLKSAECQRMRSLLSMRQKLVRLRVAAEGTIRSIFRLNGGRMKSPHSAKSLRKIVVDELERLKSELQIDLSIEVNPMLRLCESMREYTESLDQRLSEMATSNSVCSRFLEIPGIGPICALSFYTAIEDPFRFARNADVGAYLGMVPQLKQSGQSTGRARISKMGNRMTRAHLVSAAVSHMRYAQGDAASAVWSLELRERRGFGCARVALGRKLAIIMLAMWKSGKPYDPNFGGHKAVVVPIAA